VAVPGKAPERTASSFEGTVADQGWQARDAWTGAGLLALFLVTRIFWLHELPDSSFYWEEAYRWVAMQEIVAGPVRPLLDYQADHYQGGSLAAILLAVALAPLFGTSFFTIKCTALVFSGLTLLSLFALVRSFFGWSAAALAAGIYVAGPPLVAFWGVCLMGFHSESVLLSLWLGHATLVLASGRKDSSPAWLLAGALAGLAVWFTPSAAVGVVACAASWLALRGLPPARSWGPLLAGAFLGFTPWLAYNARYAWAGLRRPLETFGSGAVGDAVRSQGPWERLADLVMVVPSVGLLDPGGDLGGSAWRPLIFAGVGVPAALALLLAAGRLQRVLPRLRRPEQLPDGARLEIVFWLHLLVFAGAYLASHFTLEFESRPIGFRLMVLPAVFAMPLLAISAARALQAGGLRRVIGALASSLLLLSVASATAAMAVLHESESAPLDRQQGYVVLGRLAERKHPGSVRDAAEAIEPITGAEERRSALYGLGWGLLERYEQYGSPAELMAALDSLPEVEQEHVRGGVLWAARGRLLKVREASEHFDDPGLTRSQQRLEDIQDALTPRSPGSAGARAPLR
jgi:hypothetical protein